MASDGTFRHGIAAYKRRGCRCEVCRAAKAAQNARYRASHSKPTVDTKATAAARKFARLDAIDQGQICREWDCERAALAGGYCKQHRL